MLWFCRGVAAGLQAPLCADTFLGASQTVSRRDDQCRHVESRAAATWPHSETMRNMMVNECVFTGRLVI